MIDSDTWDTVYKWGNGTEEDDLAGQGRVNKANGELQTYVGDEEIIQGREYDAYKFYDDSSDAGDSILSIVAKEDEGAFDYTSGLLSSDGKFAFQYGYMEMRAKLPEGEGFWLGLV